MAREGRSLETLAHALETLTSADPRVTLASPGRLRDLASDQVREHDVLMTFVDGHHRVITGFECRDRTAAVGVPDVEAYAKKCQRTGVHQPVIVSATGFTDTALEAARLENVLLLALDEVDSLPWLAMQELTIDEREFLRFDAKGATDDPAAADQDLQLLAADGTPLDVRMVGQHIMMELDRSLLSEGENLMRVVSPGLVANARSSDGRIVPITNLFGDLVFHLHEQKVPVAIHSYGKPGEPGRGFASATFTADGRDMRFVMSRQDDGRLEAMLMSAEPPAQKAAPKRDLLRKVKRTRLK